MDDEKSTTEVTPPERLATIFEGSAVYSNKVYATVTPFGVRITFTETGGDQEHFRTAAFLNIVDAMSLKDLLERLLQGIEFTAVESEADDKKPSEKKS